MRPVDFLGREKPWGDNSLKNTLIGDIEDWVIVRYNPHAVLISGEDEIEHMYYCNKIKHMKKGTMKIPFFGMLSYYDLIDTLESGND